jgi:hypothetical protein
MHCAFAHYSNGFLDVIADWTPGVITWGRHRTDDVPHGGTQLPVVTNRNKIQGRSIRVQRSIRRQSSSDCTRNIMIQTGGMPRDVDLRSDT